MDPDPSKAQRRCYNRNRYQFSRATTADTALATVCWDNSKKAGALVLPTRRARVYTLMR